ncbi:unnamed protein product, partial [Mesorhabditis spiculigera]
MGDHKHGAQKSTERSRKSERKVHVPARGFLESLFGMSREQRSRRNQRSSQRSTKRGGKKKSEEIDVAGMEPQERSTTPDSSRARKEKDKTHEATLDEHEKEEHPKHDEKPKNEEKPKHDDKKEQHEEKEEKKPAVQPRHKNSMEKTYFDNEAFATPALAMAKRPSKIDEQMKALEEKHRAEEEKHRAEEEKHRAEEEARKPQKSKKRRPSREASREATRTTSKEATAEDDGKNEGTPRREALHAGKK